MPRPAAWHRARGRRSGSAAGRSNAAGSRRDIGGARQTVARLAPAARRDERRGARSDDQRIRASRAAAAGAQRGESVERGEGRAGKALDEQFAMPADDRDAQIAGASSRGEGAAAISAIAL